MCLLTTKTYDLYGFPHSHINPFSISSHMWRVGNGNGFHNHWSSACQSEWSTLEYYITMKKTELFENGEVKQNDTRVILLILSIS